MIKKDDFRSKIQERRQFDNAKYKSDISATLNDRKTKQKYFYNNLNFKNYGTSTIEFNRRFKGKSW